MVKRTSQDIRRLNRFEVLRRLYTGPGAASRQDIAAATGLSFATVANLTAELLDAGVLVEAGREDSSGGRPRARLAVNAERGALIGIDVAETSVHAEVFDLALSVRHSVERPLPSGDVHPADVVRQLTECVGQLLHGAGPDREHVLGVGVSVPGMFEREGGVSSFSPYWSWHEVPLRALLDEQLGLPLWLDNPLRAGTVAEMWFGAGREVDDLVVLTLRAGAGAGIAICGQLHRGDSPTAPASGAIPAWCSTAAGAPAATGAAWRRMCRYAGSPRPGASSPPATNGPPARTTQARSPPSPARPRSTTRQPSPPSTAPQAISAPPSPTW